MRFMFSLLCLVCVSACGYHPTEAGHDWELFKASQSCEKVGYLVSQPIGIYWCSPDMLVQNGHFMDEGHLYLRYENGEALTPAEFQTDQYADKVIDLKQAYLHNSLPHQTLTYEYLPAK